MANEVERFWSKVKKSQGCWEWTAYVNPKGYGEVRFRGRARLAHRVSWFLEHGAEPTGLVCHHCDNPRCVNPEHLFVGTHADNTADMIAKGREPRGERGGHAKLTEADVLGIRRRYQAGERERTLAREFGVDAVTVNNLLSGSTWAFLTGGRDIRRHLPGLAKLNHAIAETIRRRVAEGRTQKSVASEYGLDPSTVSDIVNRISWR